MMPETDKLKLNRLKEEVTNLAPDQATQLKQLIADVITTFNYRDLKIHSHLNELLLTINTEKIIDNITDKDNFNDIRKKLIYLIEKILSDF